MDIGCPLLSPETRIMNTYQVTYTNGEVVEIEAWTREIAQAIAEEEAELAGTTGLATVSVELLQQQPISPNR
jgi:hypothetical protein